MENIRLTVVFFQTELASEPVREWLKSLTRTDRKTIGEDIKTVQFTWPIGMPLVRKLDSALWEVRSRINNGIARVIFTIQGDHLVLIHEFVKKSQKTPLVDLRTARQRLRQLEQHE